MRDSKIDHDDRLIFAAGSTIEEGEKAALEMLNESARPTAIIAVNDLVAIGAGTVLINQGVKIPEEVSVAGFGNILVSEYFRVPLTTVRQPKLRLGYAAMELMQKLLEGGAPESRRLRAEVIARASTAPPGRIQ